MYSRTIEDAKKQLALTKRQKEILFGLLLGDGHLETQNNGRTYRLKIEHSIKQKEYVDWLYDEFRKWILTLPREKIKKREGIRSVNYGFSTVSHGALRFYAHQYYEKNGVKKVPKLIHRWLTPLALAVWYMDDGSVKSKHHRARILNTQSFHAKDIERLMNALKSRYALSSHARKQTDGLQIMILAESADDFARIVRPYIHQAMLYKLKGLD
ncbi:hypothetical protein HY623_02620 [Candidatus Uhrbacteria bacterium]|nr:hypothetical protein [Candidatus Uhrbacteria bacterium]